LTKVEQKHAKILREALCHIANRTHGQVRAYCDQKLTEFAKAVSNYCSHPEKSRLYNSYACLDCGKRFPLMETNFEARP